MKLYIYDRYGHPYPFKAAGKPHVKGGRWKIRRTWSRVKPWRAWTDGEAARFNRHFETQQEAIKYATMVANAFADPTPERIEAMIRRAMPWISDQSVQQNVMRYAKFPKPKPWRLTATPNIHRRGAK